MLNTNRHVCTDITGEATDLHEKQGSIWNYANGAFDDERASVFDPSCKTNPLSSKRSRKYRVNDADESSPWWREEAEKARNLFYR